MADTISIAITGAGGAGAITTGELLLDAAGRHGWYGLMRRSVGPQIRGGESAALLRLSSAPVQCLDDQFDLLAALDWTHVERFAAEIPLGEHSEIVADPAAGETPDVFRSTGARVTPVAWRSMSREISGGRANMLALGLLAARIGLPVTVLEQAISDRFADRGDAVLTAASQCLQAGFAVAGGATARKLANPRKQGAGRWHISGNQACGLGALRAGVRFVAAYPITPATDLLEWLAPRLEQMGGELVQAEDELASINMVLGASYGGVPALTATSGPGLALMSEALGLAVASETPVTVVNVMRGGPSTGIPTKSEQTDLNIALYGLHGEAPHLVLAPTSIGDCAYTTEWAVQLAEHLQTASIVLSDQAMGQAAAIVEPQLRRPATTPRVTAAPTPGPYLRYKLTEPGVSPMALPGSVGLAYTADGLEHDEHGTPSSRGDHHRQQLDKRLRKIETHDYGAAWAELEGRGPITIVTWGSITGAVREGLQRARALGIEARLVALRLLAPLRTGPLIKLLAEAEHVLVVEQSHSGQFFDYLRSRGALSDTATSLALPGPLAITPGQVCDALRQWS